MTGEVSVTERGRGVYVVEVAVGRSRTTHRVEVPPGMAQKIGGGPVSDVALVEESFRFLLEHEPNTSILRQFSIERIADYFPQWESEMRTRLRP
jgi:hypothetical protein